VVSILNDYTIKADKSSELYGGDLMRYEFSELVNISLLQDMAEKLYIAAKIPIGIIDIEGNVLVKAGWQRVCVDFHRKCNSSCDNCIKSDNYIFEHITGEKYVEYKCLNQMWDIAMPIYLEGQLVAALYLGQFFYSDEIIDYDRFRKQAQEYHYNEEEYMQALKEVPIFSREAVLNMLNYYQNYIQMLVEYGVKTLQKQCYITKIQKYVDIVNEMQSGLLVFQLQKIADKKTLILQSTNPAAAKLFGFDPDLMIGKSIYAVLPNLQQMSMVDQIIEIAQKHENNISGEGKYHLENQRKSIWIAYNAFSIPQNCVGIVIEDITERKSTQDEISYLSYHDQLTGLNNRRYFEEELKNSDKMENYPISIIMADVNGLKFTNDTFGHALGDQLLIAVGMALKKCTKKNELIARLGGDEFVILLPNTDWKKAEKLINKIQKYMNDKSVGVMNISISLGAATRLDDREDIHITLKKAEERMYKMKLSSRLSVRSDMLSTIMLTLYEKNKNEKMHADRVADICVKFGCALGMSETDISELKTTALLHDIGKIGLDEKILNKISYLTDEEYTEVKKHPEIGARILKASSNMADIAQYVLYHHERWDGSGYPRGIGKKAIPLQSRIIAIADAFDAITSGRSYRKAKDKNEAAIEIATCAGTQFDPILVEIFLSKVINMMIEE
jgi:diguanylate cyclase (GGDEF)-like protein/PAS domain S-box-containing protein